MALKPFSPIKFTDNLELNRVQESISQYTNQLNGKFIVDGILINASLVNGSVNLVPHGLGRVPNGYVVIYKSANSDLWDDSNPDSLFLRLNVTANVNVKLWVF